ncbi:MAG: glycosyltransferase family 2 protein [Bacteroidota bacterium]
MKNIAIVILNWNGKQFLADFLPNLVKYSADARIILADNASTDDSIEFTKSNYPNVEIVVNDLNGGFAKGYNDALKKIEAEYFLLINSDIEVGENWLLPLYEAMKDEKVAAVQPKILSFYNKNKFEHAGASGGFIDKNYFPFCRGRIFSDTEFDKNQYDGELEVFWTSGACMLIRSEVFNKLEGFDADFFAHMEEIDLCWRIKRLGYQLKVIPSSKVYHVGGGTLNYESPNKVYLNFRNSLFMITKNHKGFLFLKLFYRLTLDGIAGIQFLLKGKFTFLWAVLRAHYSFYKMLPIMLKKRKNFSPEKHKFNKVGLYKGSILWAYYFKKIRTFSKLNMRLFD